MSAGAVETNPPGCGIPRDAVTAPLQVTTLECMGCFKNQDNAFFGPCVARRSGGEGGT